MTTRMISSTFGTLTYDSGLIPAGQAASPAGQSIEYLSPANTYGIKVHDDRLYNFASGTTNVGRAIAYDQHDLRDYLVEGKALKNAMINVQRMREVPIAVQCFNVTPLRNITEVLIVTNSNIDFSDASITASQADTFLKAGYNSQFVNRNAGKLDELQEILYCERRVYAQDRSQEFTYPQSMGQMAAPPAPAPPAGVNTRWLNNWVLLDRTVSGQADMVIGPNLQIIRYFFIECYERSNQQVSTTAPPSVADEFTHLDSQVVVFFPALTVNVIGEELNLTATEKAVQYTNVFLSNQNLP